MTCEGDVTQLRRHAWRPYAAPGRRSVRCRRAQIRRRATVLSHLDAAVRAACAASDRVIATTRRCSAVRPTTARTRRSKQPRTAPARRCEIPRPGYSTQIVPDVGKVRILEQRLRLRTGEAVIGVGEPLAGRARRPGAGSRGRSSSSRRCRCCWRWSPHTSRDERVTAPLRRMAAVAARVDGGDLEPRMPSDGDAAAPRSACSPTPSTTCSIAWRSRSTASVASSPTPRMSCARR